MTEIGEARVRQYFFNGHASAEIFASKKLHLPTSYKRNPNVNLKSFRVSYSLLKNPMQKLSIFFFYFIFCQFIR